MSGSKVDLQSLINIQKEIISDVNRIPVGQQNTESGESYATELNNRLDNLEDSLNESGRNSSNIILKQGEIYDILKTENSRLENDAQAVNDARSGQIREINMNKSYILRYRAYNQLIYLIIFSTLLIMVLLFEGKYIQYLPSYVVEMLYIIIITGTIIMGLYILANIASRDKMDFSKFHKDGPNELTDAEKEKVREKKVESGDLMGLLNVCYGEKCCNDGTIFVDGKCIVEVTNDESGEEQTSTESMALLKDVYKYGSVCAYDPNMLLHVKF